MRVATLLVVLAVLASLVSAGAAPPRLAWDRASATPRLLADGIPLLEVLAAPSYSATLWRVEAGALAWDQRGSVDTFAIRQAGDGAREVWFAGDVRILDGDVAGLVLRANSGGPECFAVLL